MFTRANILIASAALGLSMAAGGCVVRTGVHAQAYVEEPNLVYVSPGVWVVEDYHEPVFYYGDYYWVQRYGVWYRSSYYTGGWVRVHATPVHIRRIHNPHRYSRYRAPRGVRTRPAPGVRDHRAPAPRGRAQPYQPRSNTRVPASRGYAPPARSSVPRGNRVHDTSRTRKEPPRTHSQSKSNKPNKPNKSNKSKSKSKSRDHR